MPNYDYECTKKKCGHVFEEFKPLADYREPAKCPKCKARSERIITHRQKGPSFTDRLYPFYHQGIGETVTSEKQLSTRCKELGYVSRHESAVMTKKQEQKLFEQRKYAKF